MTKQKQKPETRFQAILGMLSFQTLGLSPKEADDSNQLRLLLLQDVRRWLVALEGNSMGRQIFSRDQGLLNERGGGSGPPPPVQNKKIRRKACPVVPGSSGSTEKRGWLDLPPTCA